MCYALPGVVTEISGRNAVISYFGEIRSALCELTNIKPGDYVYAQGGYVIEKVDPDFAREMLDTWNELFLVLQERDTAMSERPAPEPNDRPLQDILDKAGAGLPISRDELRYLLTIEEPDRLERLYRTANAVRHLHHRNSCCVHGILEISNYCSSDCLYCGLAANSTLTRRYRMTRDEILEAAKEAIEGFGFKSLVLQSGEDPAYTPAFLAEIVAEIKRRHGVFICVSFGEVGLDGLDMLYEAGARALLMRFETSDAKLYAALHPGDTLDARLIHLRHALKTGWLTVTGGLIGLPGQTVDSLADDILLAGELNAEMFSFGPVLTSHRRRDIIPATESQMLRALAAARIAAPPQAKVLVTTAFETLSPNARERGLMSGASSVMLNVTPLRYRADYAIYDGRAHASESIADQTRAIIQLLDCLGRAPSDLGVATPSLSKLGG
ncbi:MAG: radical SAM protein [Kiritimatiellales bacterium]